MLGRARLSWVTIKQALTFRTFRSTLPERRDGRVAEGARLESVYTGNCIQGSNPCLSAITHEKTLVWPVPHCVSGFRLQAPASLTPAQRLKFESLSLRHHPRKNLGVAGPSLRFGCRPRKTLVCRPPEFGFAGSRFAHACTTPQVRIPVSPPLLTKKSSWLSSHISQSKGNVGHPPLASYLLS